jgi:hypothetical protein
MENQNKELSQDYKLIQFPEIIIKAIHHNEQAYETCGNYWWENDKKILQIRVSDTNSHYNFLIAVHELIEAYLAECKGIKEEDITKFDIEFEKMREQYPLLVGNDEPGDHDKAPYNIEHIISSKIEKWLVDNMELNWKDYEDTINSLHK